METQTVFMENGNIYVYPCGFELCKNLALCGGKVAQRGRMVTEPNGTSRFIPYRTTGASRYVPLFSTPNTIVKMSQSWVIVEVRMPRRLSAAQMRKAFKAENAEVADYLKTTSFAESINPQNPNAE